MDTPVATPFPVDPLLEPQAMLRLSEILNALTEDARQRVLAWANSRYGHATAAAIGPVVRVPVRSSFQPTRAFRDVADLFAATNPETQNDAVLVAAYWLQEVSELGDFEGASVNGELRQMGRQHPNITRALSELEDRKPAYVLVVRKGGKSAQARKLYRLTQPAIRAVQEMIAQNSGAT